MVLDQELSLVKYERVSTDLQMQGQGKVKHYFYSRHVLPLSGSNHDSHYACMHHLP